VNGHGSNMPNLDPRGAAARTFETGRRECCVAPRGGTSSRWTRRSCRSGGRASSPAAARNACELETSLYLYLDADNVRKDLIKNGTISFNRERQPGSNWVDCFAARSGD